MDSGNYIDIALAVSMFASQVEFMEDDEVKKMLIQIFTNLQYQKNKYDQQIKKAWGIST
jgi:hypothetical protein